MEDGFIIKDGVLEAYTLRDAIVEVPDKVTSIGKGAFKGCISIEQVTLPEGVTEIMDTAFKGCRKLKEINFPSNLTHIGEHAFHRCHSLRIAKLPDTVTTLGRGAFLLCDSLEFVSIKGVKKLNKQVFLNDVNLKTIEVSSDLDISNINEILMGCSKISEIVLSDGTVCNVENVIEVISEHSKAHPVAKSIVTDIFRMLMIKDGILQKLLINVKDVEIPNGITGISKNCFSNKKGLVSVTFPETLTDIGSLAFSNCISLSKIEFSSENININRNAFINCTSLKHIALADGNTYELIKNLSETSDESTPHIISTIHSQILNNFFVSGTTLIKYRGNEERVIVPDHVTVIGEKAFAGNEVIDKVILPDSIREIREDAFSDCLLLQNIDVPKGLTSLGKSAFENCVKLIRIDLPESLTTIEKSAFNRCRKLKDVQFGSNIKEIDDLAFYSCSSLKNLLLPEKLKSIGDMAFYKCLSLKEVILPESLDSLGNNVFTAAGLKSATINCDLKKCGTDIFSQCNKLWSLTFSEGIKNIGDKFAFGSTSLKYVNLPSSIENIGRNAFENSIYIKETVKEVVAAGTICINGDRILGEVEIPEGITAIAGGAFYGNTLITSVKFPKSLKRIGSRAFCGCTSLKSITLPDDVTVLEEGVFAYCTSLRSVVSKGRISRISDNAFYECNTILKVPSSKAVHIGKNAFNGCRKLENIEINCTDIQAGAFRKTQFLQNIREKSSLVIISDTVVDGKNCTKEIIIPENVVSIAPYAFAGNDSITGIKFPDNLESIGEDAFGGCKNLKEITLPSLKYIGKKAFEKCVSLISVKGNVETLEEGVFSYCINLKKVIIEKTISFGKEVFSGCSAIEIIKCNELQYIGDSCFNGCDSLCDFDFSNIKSIGHRAFGGCNSLKSISLNAETIVEAHAFEDCCSIEKIELSEEGLQFGSYAFAGCTALKAIVICEKRYTTDHYSVISKKQIPDSVKSIYNSAISCFDIDENLSIIEYKNNGISVHIPDGIKAIKANVFIDVMNLEKIYIPESVEYIGERTFNSTIWLEEQKAVTPMVIINNILVDASLCQGDVVIPESVKIVSGWAFANCYALTGISFSSKTVVEKYAFRNCINLKSVTDGDDKEYHLIDLSDRYDEMLPNVIRQIFTDCLNCFKTEDENVLIECTGNINDLVLPDGITAINDNVFKDSNLLTYISLSKDTVKIGKSAFEHCKWLVSVKNAYGVERIEKHAFSGCSLLENLELSDKLKYIGPRAFEHCLSLKSVVIPEGITKIPEKAFYRCKNLVKITLPTTLKTIGKEAFAFCDELTDINFPEELESIDTRTFAWCSALDKKHLPEGVSVKTDSFSTGSI
ncbi:MAG: leucine-rich repeat protein [Deltaproteobacteria bacterium]|nr:leucine-rich repeat protein [Deltaproteobacteria bacterium]